MKKLHLFKRTLLLLALIVGFVNYGWADTTGKINFGSAVGSTKIEGSSSSGSGTVTYTDSGNDDQDNTWTITTVTSKSKSFTQNSSYSQVGSSSNAVTSITLTTTLAENVNVKSFSAKFGGFNGTAGTITLKVGDTTVGSGSLSAATDVTVSSSSAQVGKVLTVTVTGIAKGVKVYNISYTYEAAKTLDHITLSGTYPTSFTEQDEFSHEGMTVTANYDDSSSKDVTSSAIFTGYDMDEIGNQTVTVSYTEGNTTKTVTYDITINAGEKYTVDFDPEAGICGTASLKESAYKGGVILPAATIELDGWTFAGWAEASQTSTQNRPILYLEGDPYYPTANTTLYAVYTLEGIDGTKYQRVTELSEATSASSMIFVDKVNSKVFKYNGNDVTYDTAPTETNGQITPSDDIVWTLDGNNTDGYNVKTTSLETNRSAGFDTPAESTNYANIKTYLSNSVSNGLWKFVQSKKGSDLFTLRNNTEKLSGYVGSLRFYASNSKWQVYYLAASGFDNNDNTALKLYVPVKTAYNSNPDAAIIQPTVGFEKGNTTLYLDGTTTYTNAASVTGVDKSVTGYRSSNENVATVAADGTVTAVGIGTATITAYLDAELGVHKAAQATYNVVVKTTTTIAGLKTIDKSTGVAFAADLTDAVVTYVAGNYAYIQDASAAILVNKSEHGLVAGQKINGAVSGTVKITYSIYQLTAIDLSAATVTEDGAIPTALTKTVAEVSANAAALDGQLVTINTVTVDKPSTTTTLKDGSKIAEEDATITMYSPNGVASVNDKEKGNFTGFVSLYNGDTPRINLYEQSQFTKTHNAPTAQTLSFEDGDEAFDEVTSALSAFTGKSVEGAHTAVTYSKVDASSIIGDFNTETGALTLNGACGTATITASAAAGEVVEAGVTTPYLAASESYTITVSPRYMVTFSVNGVETVLRQATSGAAIAVPTPSDFGDYKFMGWSKSTVAPTDDEPSMTDLGATVIPEDNNDTYYAVFAQEENVQTPGEITSTLTLNSGTVSSPYENNGVTWTFSGLDFVSSGNGDMPNGSTVTFTLPVTATSTVSVNAPAASAWSAKNISIALTDANSTNITTFNDGISYTFTSDNNKSSAYTLTATNKDSRKAYMNTITVVYNGLIDDITYSDYRTSLPTVEVTITDAQYATFCYARELNVKGTDVTAYTASANGEGNAVTLTKISDGIIPANTGVILFAETAGNYEINVSETNKGAIDGNELVGVTARTQIPETSADKYNYIFSKKDEVIGFYRASGAYLLPNRAYLSTSTKGDAAAREFMAIMFDEGETTSLREVRGLKADVRGEFFNLNGQRVATPVKGNIYIVNGKKVMFK